jgi:predicted PurR-regulated permease PerM
VLAVFAGIILIVIPVLVGQISQLVVQIQRSSRASWTGRGTRSTSCAWLHSTFPALDVDKVFGTSPTGTTHSTSRRSARRRQHDPRHRRRHHRGFTGALIVLILTIYFTASTPDLKAAVSVVPASKRARFIDLSEQITASVGYYVMGQVTLGVINGVLSAIFLTIIRRRSPPCSP